MMPSPVLHIDHLHLVTSHGDLTHDLSLAIHPGEIVALTGKSGTGKTSLALAVMGLLSEGVHMKAGTIQFAVPDGTTLVLPDDAAKWSLLRGRHIGFIQQDIFGAFDPVIRMGKQLMMIIRERTGHQDEFQEAALRKSMVDVGLYETERIWNSFPHQLSGGQLQRCLLCLCLVIKPSLIIADEPTSAIDKSLQKELMDVFLFVRKELSTAILCITHDPAVVSYMADRSVSLDTGEDTLPDSSRFDLYKTINQDVVVEAIGLHYQHRFGGILEKKGAALLDISFTLLKGQSVGIVGPSGSGKSTLAQMLVGLLTPSAGTLRIDGKDIDFTSSTSVRYLRSNVQLVMQDGRGALHPFQTISTSLQEIQISDKSREAIDVEKAVTEVGLPVHILNRKPDQLSGGECLRVNIARSLLLNPEVLICDESTAALDVPTRDGILQLLRKLIETRGLSLIMITHDPEVILRMTHQVLVMDNGKVVEQGKTDMVLNNPVHEVSKNIFKADATLSSKRNL